MSSESTSTTSSSALPSFTYSYNAKPNAPLQPPDTSRYDAVEQTDANLLEGLGFPLTIYMNESGTPPYFGTEVEGHKILFDFSDPTRLEFCDYDDGNCYSFRDDVLHVFPFSGSEIIAAYDPPASLDTKRSVRTPRGSHPLHERGWVPTIPIDTEFTASADFVDQCRAELTSLTPFPEFFFDGVPCVNKHDDPSTNNYQGVCKYVTAKETKCRANVKYMIDHSIGSDGIFKYIDSMDKLWKKVPGWIAIPVTAAVTTGIRQAVIAFGVEAGFAMSALVLGKALIIAGLLRLILVDTFGSENTAMVLCKAAATLLVLGLDVFGPHDVTVKSLGMTFDIATLKTAPTDDVFLATEFVITTLPEHTCAVQSLLRNGGFEEDGAMVPFPNDQGWWLPEAPSDPVAFASWDGWQVTTNTNPEAAITTEGCLKGVRCLQLYALAAPGSAAAARVYQLMHARFTPGKSYIFTFWYRIDFLNVLTGTMGATNYCYLFSSFQFTDAGAQPGFLRLTNPVKAGTGEWIKVSRTITYQTADPRASSDEFQILCACNAPSSNLQLAATLDELSVLPA